MSLTLRAECPNAEEMSLPCEQVSREMVSESCALVPRLRAVIRNMISIRFIINNFKNKKNSPIFAGMKKVLFIILCLVQFSTFSAEAQKSMALVSVSVTDMKKAPDYQSETVSQAMMGTPVEVTGKEGYWYSIVTPEGYAGWTTEQNIFLISEEEMERWKQADRLIVKEYFTVVTAGPSDRSGVLSDCVMGNIVEPDSGRSSENGYVPVVLPDGRKGYVPAGSVQNLRRWMEDAAGPSGEDIVSTASRFLGFPYLWGGLSPKGVDCSGLVKLSYFLNGIILLRDASQQIDTGDPLDYSDILGSLQAGDLVFFGRSATDTRGRSVSHVGICMGNGMMIHSSLRVRVNSLLPGRPDSYTSKKIVGACRILGHQDTEPGIVTVLEHPWYF
jgi:cell wall-associated NlpC family hydrolase